MIQAKDGIHSYEEIAAKTYRIDETGIANCYLLIGEKSALLIDSGVGVGDLLGTVRELTSLPLTLALTHRHCDHAGGRDFFKNYYVHEADKPLVYKILSSHFASKELLKATNRPAMKLSKKPYHSKAIFLKDDATFDLGGRTISILHVPGHTEGSVVFLDPTTHLMFTGDDVNPYLWLQLPGCTSLTRWLVGAEKILALANSYTPYCGHDPGILTKEGIATLIVRVKEVLAKKPEFKGKQLDYPLDDKKAFPRFIVARKGIK
jgi:glyoxylase-like metal-dependent hydrolase (beta-lactamase superfamily II)